MLAVAVGLRAMRLVEHVPGFSAAAQRALAAVRQVCRGGDITGIRHTFMGVFSVAYFGDVVRYGALSGSFRVAESASGLGKSGGKTDILARSRLNYRAGFCGCHAPDAGVDAEYSVDDPGLFYDRMGHVPTAAAAPQRVIIPAGGLL